MRPPADAVETAGRGPDLVLVHGTAADVASSRALARLLRDRARVTVYPRRGTPGWPVPVEGVPTSVGEHADDLADLIEALGGGPVHLFGASLGAIVALELCRTRPERVRGAALFEPPVAADDGAPAVPTALLAAFERRLARGRPEEAAELFHRRVLGAGVWSRLAEDAKQRARSLWPHLHGDLRANAAHRVCYAELREVEVPILLLRGGRTGSAFDAPLCALEAALPHSRQRVVARAGHGIGAPAWGDLAEALADFMDA